MKKALIGNGGHSKEVIMQMGINPDEIILFVHDKYYDNKQKNVLPLSKFDPNEFEVMVCIGNSKDRSYVVNSLPKTTKYFTFIHKTALIGNNCTIGEGSFVGANSIITTNVNIGKHALLNRGNHIGHDCIIDDFFTMMPGSIISGSCRIGKNVFIGTNSSAREKIILCDNIIVGLNSGIIKSILEPGVYGGTPTKKIK